MSKELSAERSPSAAAPAPLAHYTNAIGGRRVTSAGGTHYTIRNPARPGERLAAFADSTRRCTAAVDAADRAAAAWPQHRDRNGAPSCFDRRTARGFEDQLARIVTLDRQCAGEAAGEVGRAAAEARFMAGEASRPTAVVSPARSRGTCTTISEPLGVVAAICPWNFPVVTPVRKIAPAIAFGNTVVFKPAGLTPWSAVHLMDLFERAGLPPGVVNLITGSGAVVGEALVNDPRVRGITFTGSTRVGPQVYEPPRRRLAAFSSSWAARTPRSVVGCEDLDTAAREIVGPPSFAAVRDAPDQPRSSWTLRPMPFQRSGGGRAPSRGQWPGAATTMGRW